MKTVKPRAIAFDELNLIRNAVTRAGIGPSPNGVLDDISNISVIGECECGCRSVYFCNISAEDFRIADGVGYMPNGERVDIIVWANSGGLAALEIVDHAGNGILPIPESVCSWEEAGAWEARK